MDMARPSPRLAAMTETTENTRISATRTHALERLRRLVPRAGHNYAARRNFDLAAQGPSHVDAGAGRRPP